LGLTFDAGPLKVLMDKHPGSKISIFGHADPVGKDEFNKVLSGRRAQAIFGLLVRDVGLWNDLYFHHDTQGKDRWGVRPVQVMLNLAGPTKAGSADGKIGQNTRQALADFEAANALPSRGFNQKEEISPATFDALALSYMNTICTDDDGNQFQVSREDFIARGTGKDGKGDFQGCGEFNPLMIFSLEERKFFDREENKKRRNVENQINRRIMILLYLPGTRIDPTRWPCPTVKEGTAGCKRRFFANADIRRSNLDERREHKDEKTIPGIVGTFACRFYDRQASGSPCEGLLGNLFQISVVLLTNSGAVALGNEPFTLTINDGRVVKDSTSETGGLLVSNVPPGDHLLDIAGVRVTIPAMLRGEDPRPTRVPGARPFDAPQESSAFFRYSLQMTANLPWSRKASLRIVSEDGSEEQKFLLNGGSRFGDSLVFVFRKFKPGVLFRGEVTDGDVVLEIFPATDLSKIQDSADPLNILPLSAPNRFANEPDPSKDTPPPPSVDPQVTEAVLGREAVL
jgi:hypothetical protein